MLCKKLRTAEGIKYPGAWAGAVVFNDEDEGVSVLTSQEKWDKLKRICQHWFSQLDNLNTALDHKTLRSDRGFLVYVTQAYPAMVPYLKGIHILLKPGEEEEMKNDGKLKNQPLMKKSWVMLRMRTLLWSVRRNRILRPWIHRRLESLMRSLD